ncbi:MAG: hypothetical protein KAI17_21890, partial [Thiotrichaceae bacterium]|nr:hypothetical protein [Thiotrichaceae bacterium]
MFKKLLFIVFILLSQSVQSVQIEIEIEGVKNELLENVQAYLNFEEQKTPSGLPYNHIIDLHKNVRAYLSLEQQKDHPRLSKSRIRRLHKQAPAEIKKALLPFGYYRATVTSSLSRPKIEEIECTAKYIVTLGESLKIDLDIQITGEAKTDDFFNNLLDDFPVKKGDTLNHPNYERAKTVLRNLAEERGYFNAKFSKHEIEIDEQDYKATIRLYFNSGKRYRFGEVIFKQDFFEESFLRRFLNFKSGDFYTEYALLSFKNALLNADYFDNAEIDMPRSSSSGNVYLPINVTLHPRKPNKWTTGIGYGTDTGVRGSLGYERRYVNRYGHSLSAKT